MNSSRYRLRSLLKLSAIVVVAGLLFFLGYRWGCGCPDSHPDASLVIAEGTLDSGLIGEAVAYEDMVGTWILTTESRLNLAEFLHSIAGGDEVSDKGSIRVTQFSLMIVLSGRHFSLYNREYLIGTMGALPTLSDGNWKIRNPFESDRVWKEDRTGERLADSKLVGYGLDLPVKAVIWAMREPHAEDANGLASLESGEKVGSLVMREEANPDMWSELYLSIILKESRLRLQRVLNDFDSKNELLLEWRKVR